MVSVGKGLKDALAGSLIIFSFLRLNDVDAKSQGKLLEFTYMVVDEEGAYFAHVHVGDAADDPSVDFSHYFDQVFDFIEEHAKFGSVLVHWYSHIIVRVHVSPDYPSVLLVC